MAGLRTETHGLRYAGCGGDRILPLACGQLWLAPVQGKLSSRWLEDRSRSTMSADGESSKLVPVVSPTKKAGCACLSLALLLITRRDLVWPPPSRFSTSVQSRSGESVRAGTGNDHQGLRPTQIRRLSRWHLRVRHICQQ